MDPTRGARLKKKTHLQSRRSQGAWANTSRQAEFWHFEDAKSKVHSPLPTEHSDSERSAQALPAGVVVVENSQPASDGQRRIRRRKIGTRGEAALASPGKRIVGGPNSGEERG